MDFDVVVIGTGPGGYVGAIRMAQLGLKTAVVEKDKTYGGTCLNVKCIPSKALLESSEHYEAALHDLSKHGVKVGSVQLDLPTMLARKETVVKDNANGVAFLFKKNKIEQFKGVGKILKSGVVEVTAADGTKTTLNAKSIVCATGSTPVELPFLKFDEKKVVSSTGALSLQAVPKDLVVVGGGVIGLELGSVWMRLGAQVTVIEFADRLCPTMDTQMMSTLQKVLAKQGMKFMFKTKVINSQTKGSQIELEYENMSDGAKSKISADVVLVSTGRRPYSDGLGLDEVGVKKDQRGFVQVDKHYQTNVPGIYAIGDLTPGPMLAHKAEEEGVALAEILAGQAGHVNYQTVPSVIYTHPEVASVGLTEEQVKEMQVPYSIGTFPFMANGRARALGFTEGLVKIITDQRSDKIIGGHIVGPRASELIGEIVIAMEFGGSSEDLARSFHAHPTLNEAIREAALAVDKRARQI
ncbi:MAG: dihydrolipoyl dehydrogenase [Bdellovibrio sp. CG10_big_fil_rev_8_21_14_0_10_47_8]|nr:MAG: dihydrolipoyl dehydrogenase [Bdellovibrio sp. CG10_big_fil_rev_8_21_14_0_10_47_8]